jgi:hypothetical protein
MSSELANERRVPSDDAANPAPPTTNPARHAKLWRAPSRGSILLRACCAETTAPLQRSVSDMVFRYGHRRFRIPADHSLALGCRPLAASAILAGGIDAGAVHKAGKLPAKVSSGSSELQAWRWASARAARASLSTASLDAFQSVWAVLCQLGAVNRPEDRDPGRRYAPFRVHFALCAPHRSSAFASLPRFQRATTPPTTPTAAALRRPQDERSWPFWQHTSQLVVALYPQVTARADQIPYSSSTSCSTCSRASQPSLLLRLGIR